MRGVHDRGIFEKIWTGTNIRQRFAFAHGNIRDVSIGIRGWNHENDSEWWRAHHQSRESSNQNQWIITSEWCIHQENRLRLRLPVNIRWMGTWIQNVPIHLYPFQKLYNMHSKTNHGWKNKSAFKRAIHALKSWIHNFLHDSQENPLECRLNALWTHESVMMIIWECMILCA